jgi:pyruvate dehydrogenase E1 component beta subunit
LLVVDNCWITCGASAEIVSQVVEGLQGERQVRVQRLGFAPVTCPPTPALEELFYPNARTVAAAAYALVTGNGHGWMPAEREELRAVSFRGPF